MNFFPHRMFTAICLHSNRPGAGRRGRALDRRDGAVRPPRHPPRRPGRGNPPQHLPQPWRCRAGSASPWNGAKKKIAGRLDALWARSGPASDPPNSSQSVWETNWRSLLRSDQNRSNRGLFWGLAVFSRTFGWSQPHGIQLHFSSSCRHLFGSQVIHKCSQHCNYLWFTPKVAPSCVSNLFLPTLSSSNTFAHRNVSEFCFHGRSYDGMHSEWGCLQLSDVKNVFACKIYLTSYFQLWSHQFVSQLFFVFFLLID